MKMLVRQLLEQARARNPELSRLPDPEVLFQSLRDCRRILLGGDTIKISPQLRELGGTLHPVTREWVFQAGDKETVRALCELVAWRLITLECA